MPKKQTTKKGGNSKASVKKGGNSKASVKKGGNKISTNFLNNSSGNFKITNKK